MQWTNHRLFLPVVCFGGLGAPCGPCLCIKPGLSGFAAHCIYSRYRSCSSLRFCLVMSGSAVCALALGLCAAAVCLARPTPGAAGPVQPCAAPLQWEGRAVQYDHGTGRNTRAAVSYDAQNQRIRVLEEIRKHTPCKRYFEYIYLFQSGVLFQIEQLSKNCAKLNLTEAWDPFDIPMNSTYEDQYFIGGPGDMIQVQEWSDRKPARKHETWVGVYTLNDCYPVQETYTKNSSVTTSTRFFDLALGITDPGVFTPPSTCQSAVAERMDSDC